MTDPIAIFSIDDHEIIHQGIERMAEREPDFVFLGATGKITNAESEVAAARPDIVMLDLFIGEDQGWSVCRDIVTSMPDTKVVFYTGYGNAQLVEKAIQLGASGFILKTSPLSDLPDMLRTVVRVGQCIDPSLLKEWVDSRRARTKAPDFNDQEILIVSMIADGLDNYAISERLHLSFHTVKFHIGKMLKRTGESNRAGLVRFAKEKFLID
ncbi:MAG: two component LuxR family transcriptional regulator [Arthrobacter sp.]|jgi:DNA-binding NarL/FixJ family response regulator|nr:two component LuxR family transcriptional regulator [Arthrobacter sp.]